jgi:hypothetical protein
VPVPLCADGNGIAELRRIINLPGGRATLGNALRTIATLGNVEVAIDSSTAELREMVALPSGRSSVAEAMLETIRGHAIEITVASDGTLSVAATRDRRVPTLSAVTVTASSDRQRRFSEQAASGALSYGVKDLASAPGFFGSDVLRAARLLPGLDARNDYSSSLNVRGGESDQTLVMLDGIPIYQPFHLGGLLGTFIDPAVGKLDLYSGVFPAAYNGRLSALLDVRSAEETRTGAHGTFDISLLSSSASVGGASTDASTTWLFAGRRTYADQVARLAGQKLPYHFQDANVHATHLFDGGSALALTAYAGTDVVYPSTARDTLNVEWGNVALGLSWSAMRRQRSSLLHADSVSFIQRAFITKFDADVAVAGEDLDIHSHVHDTRLNGTLTTYAAGGEQSAGYEIARQRVSYTTLGAKSVVANFIPVGSSDGSLRSVSGWYSGLWKLTPSFLFDVGTRIDFVEGLGAPTLSPRASAKILLSPSLALTASAGRHVQWLHSVLREETPFRVLDFWTASSATVPPTQAWVYSLGVERWASPLTQLRIEAFHKTYRDLIVRNSADDPLVDGGELEHETGRSSGVDVLLRRLEHNGFSGWLSYTLAYSRRTMANGVTYAPSQDRRHDLNLVGSWQGRRYLWGARLGVSTGTPFTGMEGQFLRKGYDPIDDLWGSYSSSNSSSTQFLPTEHNGERYPLAHRLDVSVTRTGVNGAARTTPYLSIANVYGRLNPAIYYYDFSAVPNSRYGIANFRFLPTFGIRHVF